MVLPTDERAETVPRLLHFPIGTDQGFGVRGSRDPPVIEVGDHVREERARQQCDNFPEMFRRREG